VTPTVGSAMPRAHFAPVAVAPKIGWGLSPVPLRGREVAPIVGGLGRTCAEHAPQALLQSRLVEIAVHPLAEGFVLKWLPRCHGEVWADSHDFGCFGAGVLVAVEFDISHN
jgi:hypothetical protein